MKEIIRFDIANSNSFLIATALQDCVKFVAHLPHSFPIIEHVLKC